MARNPAPARPAPKRTDRTNSERQARYRESRRRALEALEAIRHAATLKEAKEIAVAALEPQEG